MPICKWELKDPKRCDGCRNLTDQSHPCCRLEHNLFYFEEDGECIELNGERPQSCIDEFGN